MPKNLKAEASSGSVTFDYKDVTYTVETDFDVEVMEHLEEGMVVKATKALVGESQYASLKLTKPKMSDLNDFMDAAFKALGTNLGESTA